MVQRYDGRTWLLRFDKGELVVAELTRFVTEQQLPGGWLVGLGGAQWAELGFYQLEQKTYTWQRVDELLEAVSLHGNIAWTDGEPAVHMHGVFSKHDLQTVGGHVKEFSTGGTCEVLIYPWQGEQLTRSHSDDIGLKLLNL